MNTRTPSINIKRNTNDEAEEEEKIIPHSLKTHIQTMYKFLRAQALRLIKMQGAEYFSYGRVVKCHHNY